MYSMPNAYGLASPAPSMYSHLGDPTSPLSRHSPDSFQIERVNPRPALSRKNSMAAMGVVAAPRYDSQYVLQESISKFLYAKSRMSAISGTIPLDSSQLVLFFRTKSGITHSLDFPLDIDYNCPPALDVLIAASRPHSTDDLDDYDEHESLFWPANLPLTTSLELANHPILDQIRDSLFPTLPRGHYLTAVRDKLEVLRSGSRLTTQTARNDGRVATVMITLPVRYRGGALIVRDTDGNEEQFVGRGAGVKSNSGDLEWTAFQQDCEYEIETVQKGCRMSLSYTIFVKSFGPPGVTPAMAQGGGPPTDPLFQPSDKFLDMLAPLLNAFRGRKIGFHLTHSYGQNPAENLADMLVPELKGGDALLYHACKLYKLNPEMHWYAGGYVWPVDKLVEIVGHPAHSPHGMPGIPLVGSEQWSPNRSRNMSLMPAGRGGRNQFNIYGAASDAGSEETDVVRQLVEDSGAFPVADFDITIMTDPMAQTPPVVGKERVAFVMGGELDKLVVNALLVVFVP